MARFQRLVESAILLFIVWAEMKISIKHPQKWQEFAKGACTFYVSPSMDETALESLANMGMQGMEEAVAQESLDNVTILVMSGNCLLFKSDIVNTRPIYYTEDGLQVSDDVAGFSVGAFDLTSLKEYVIAGYATGYGTLFRSIRKSRAGELLIVGPDGIRAKKRFDYRYPAEARDIVPEAAHEEVRVFGKVLDEAIHSAVSELDQGRQIIVPLSGGHDSRLLVSRLATLGVENVLCFSYGRVDNEQSRISRQVAEALGYRWHFVEHTEEKWQALHDAGVIEAYARFAFRGSSIPHLQDFLAVHELRQSGMIARGDLCMPGHTLDFVAGGHIGQADFDCDDADSAVKRVLRRHFPGLPDDGADEPELVARIHELFEVFDGPPSQFQEWFNWRERQTKFIVNSCATYEFHGLQVALPFWDVDVVRYWLSVPPEAKAGRQFYFEMEPYLLDPRLLEIPFAGETKTSRSLSQRIQLALRKRVPTWLSSRLVSASRLRRRQNEGLNLAFAGLGEDIRSALPHLAAHPIAEWPPIRDILCRRPYQLNGHRMAALYTLNLLLAQQSESPEAV